MKLNQIKLLMLSAVLGLAAFSYCTNTGTATTGAAECGATNPAATSIISGATTDSSAAVTSHRSGEDCLSCHSAGGSSATAFLAAGTIYTAKSSTSVNQGFNITYATTAGNKTLTSDQCGNFYTTATAPVSGFNASTVNRSRTHSGVSNGSCNTAGCHVAGTRLY